MKHLVNTLYSIALWFAVGTIGFGSWVGRAVLALAIDMSITTIWKAVTE